MSQDSELHHNVDNQRFQRREWRFQRIGWIVMLLFLISGILGFAGPGLFSYVTTGHDGDPVRLSYHRFEHWNHESVMELTLDPRAVHNGEARIWITSELFHKIELKQIHPAPAKTEAAHDRITYTFAISDTSAPLSVQISYEPDAPGLTRARLGTDGYATDFWQWVYP